jgi:hypothetical protein
MKLHISITDLEKLTNSGKVKLREWWTPEGGDLWTLEDNIPNGSSYLLQFLNPHFMDIFLKNEGMLPLLSIGQLIQYLDEYSNKDWRIDTEHHDDPINCKDHLGLIEYSVHWANDKGQIGNVAENKELCDALFEAVKDILNKP